MEETEVNQGLTDSTNKPANRFEVRKVRQESSSHPNREEGEIVNPNDADSDVNLVTPSNVHVNNSVELVNGGDTVSSQAPKADSEIGSIQTADPCDSCDETTGSSSPSQAGSLTACTSLQSAPVESPQNQNRVQKSFLVAQAPTVTAPPRIRLVSIQSNGDTSTSIEYDPNNSDTQDTYRKLDTTNLKTFGKNTHEAIPHLDFYRQTANSPNYKRPTLEELREEKVSDPICFFLDKQYLLSRIGYG